MRRPRILIGAILHETNTFNHILTRLADFEGRYLCLDTATIRAQLTCTATEMGGFIQAADANGWDAKLAVAAACGPSGPIAAQDWQRLRGKLLDAPGPFDGVLLALHGAMVTEDESDPEGALLAELRARLGPSVPIVVTLDMHANLSRRMVEAADAHFVYETYPHVDHADCAALAAGALERLLEQPLGAGRLTRKALVRPPMLDAADHGRTDPPGPMNALLARARMMRDAPGVVSAALTIGFPWADVAEAGPAALVTTLATSDADPAPPARELAQALWHSRHDTQLDFATPEQAMARARLGRPGDAPLVLADFADNPAAGAHGDSPNLLRAMLDAGLEDAAFATLSDARAVARARDAGEGARIELTLGGQHTPQRTPPLPVTARVERLHKGAFRAAGPVLRGVGVDMGPMALLRVGGVSVVVASRALAVTDVNLFHALGLDPARLRTIALKSRNHHRAAFGPLAREVMLVDAGGIATMRLGEIGYRNLTRPIWPLDAAAGPYHFAEQEIRHDDLPLARQ
ncbi:MAG: M81 family metallopeptidase [Pararhodobacter sp.]|nr:M81 family metallopeptidase [Pararhodobacter sp.]